MIHFNKNRILGIYKNGNYKVIIYNDGTKIRFTKENSLIPDFPETADVKITDRCDGGCPFCYEGCTVKGNHGMLMNPDGTPYWKFFENINPYTEIALNGNDLTHPDLENFLNYLKTKKLIPNMTVNQKHFIKHYDLLKEWVDKKLIYGLGISLTDSTDKDFLKKAESFNNSVIHVINGIISSDDWDNMKDYKLKFLVLGYKDLQRGISYKNDNLEKIQHNQNHLRNNINNIIKQFPVISFDNLAIEQLDIKNNVFGDDNKKWNTFYMGDDGGFSLYIDLVKGQFAKNSCMPMDKRYPIGDLSMSEMLKFIKINNQKNK